MPASIFVMSFLISVLTGQSAQEALTTAAVWTVGGSVVAYIALLTLGYVYTRIIWKMLTQ